ncbi:hypothetical protein RJ640_018180 [Escallonia rubra]|uniref:Uncharacterized protein n=1 Tax=Escallonia rubra TaxID=112253 RepID=A0AA88QW65_9ASTE|nr:hypothetical protein RJ640_018180 [Escallonia rubra]
MAREEAEEDDVVCLDESFFINDNYQLTTFTFGSQVLELLCLHSASTDFDLTGQLVWPGAMLLNDYLSKNPEMLRGCSVIEFGSGVGVTGILCSRFCHEIVLTDHNEEVLKASSRDLVSVFKHLMNCILILQKNIELHESSESSKTCTGLVAQKLEWGNFDQLQQILQRHVGGFDLVLGADIYILIDLMSFNIPLLFDTAEKLLRIREKGKCKFILAYVSRAKTMDEMVIGEAVQHGLQINEIAGTRSVIGYHEGVIYEIILQ